MKQEISLSPGLTCLLGANGCGKSNLVRGIYFGLTGESLGDDDISDFLRWGTTRGEVIAKLQADKGEIQISRKFKPGPRGKGLTVKHAMAAPWLEEPVEKKTDINNQLAALMGLDLRYLDEVVFARQGSFEQMLRAQHVERVKTIYSLLGLDRAESLRGHLLAAKNTIREYPDRGEELGELQESLEGLRKEYTGMQDTLKELKEPLGKMQEEYNKLLRVRALPDKEELDKLLGEMSSELASKESLVKQARDSLAALAVAEAPVPDSEGFLKHQRALEVQAELDKVLEEAKEHEQKMPDKVTDEMREQADMTALQPAKLDLDRKREELALAEKGDCPTCHRPFDISPEKLKEMEQDYKNKMGIYNAETERRVARAKEILEMDAAVASWEQKTAQLADRLKSRGTEMGELSSYLDFDVQKYEQEKQLVEDASKMREEREQVQGQLNSLTYQVGQLQASIEAKAGTEAADADTRKAAEEFISSFEQARESAQALELDAAKADTRIQGITDQITRLEQEQAKSRKTGEVVQILESSRDILHPNKLPMMTARQIVGNFNEVLKKYLHLFDFQYVVRLTDELDFVYDHPFKRDARVANLSGGQTLVVAMAIRFTLLEMFSFGCGLLVLDEPTTFLDPDNVAILSHVLARASEYFRARQVAILVPTHEKALMAMADDTIELT